MNTTNLKNDQRGLGHVVMIILIVVVLGVVGFAGYTVAGKNKKASTVTTSTTSTSEKKAADAGCVTTYKDENLCKFANNVDIDKKAFKATLTGTDASGNATSMTLQSDGMGNTALSGTGNGESFESVQIGKDGYIKTDGVWYKYPSGSSAADATNDPTKKMDLTLGSGITYQPQGKETCGSLTCFKYKVTEAATPDAIQYVWFDTNDYLLRKWTYSDKTSGNTEMVITYASVSITAPAGAKDFSAMSQ